MRKKKWFPKNSKHTGWRKIQKPTTRRSKLLRSTDKRMTMRRRYLLAARRAQALSNVTTDEKTKQLALQDAKYFFKKL